MIIAPTFRIATFDPTGWATDPTIREDLFIVWTQTELGYSIISATIPILRPFMHNLNSHFGGMGKTSNGYGYGYGYEHSSNRGYQLSNLKSADKSRSMNEADPMKSTGALDPQARDYNYEIWAHLTKIMDSSLWRGRRKGPMHQKMRRMETPPVSTAMTAKD
jgi:hypothetical protein